jgi:hypothetical protein
MQQKTVKLEKIAFDNGALHVYVVTRADKEISARFVSGNFFDAYSTYFDRIGK